jgi:hypothetical protein
LESTFRPSCAAKFTAVVLRAIASTMLAAIFFILSFSHIVNFFLWKEALNGIPDALGFVIQACITKLP